MSAHRSELPEWECLSLIRQEVVGRVCLIDHGCPLAFPVKYRLIGDGADPSGLRARLLSPEDACAKAGVDPEALRDSQGMKFVGDLFYALTAPDPEPFLVRVRAQLAGQDPAAPTLPHFLLVDLVLALLDGDRDRAIERSARLAAEDPATATRLRAMVFGVDRLRQRLDALGLRVEADGRLSVIPR